MTVFLYILLGIFLGLMLRVSVHVKRTNDMLYEIAVSQFYDACDSLLKTADELPDGVLRLLSDMSSTLHHRYGSFAYYLTVASPSDETGKSGAGEQVYGDPRQRLRPEIEALLDQAASGWLSALRYKSTIVGLAVARLIRDEQVRSKSLAPKLSRALPDRIYLPLSRAA